MYAPRLRGTCRRPSASRGQASERAPAAGQDRVARHVGQICAAGVGAPVARRAICDLLVVPIPGLPVEDGVHGFSGGLGQPALRADRAATTCRPRQCSDSYSGARRTGGSGDGSMTMTEIAPELTRCITAKLMTGPPACVTASAANLDAIVSALSAYPAQVVIDQRCPDVEARHL